ncbi:MAG TPA: 1,6-anhydro-N-acetylmuramyl-L-alanine amidase AmpD [Gammaproteobacteria bacterium]|jgi:AmpD protein|nr:1,6-anhydro-N-acetylmuramyl-L-alanine amidase AmpD [Gammaproteobacteria bacterium]
MTNQMLSLNPETGCLEGVPFLASPHQDARPEGLPIDLLVVHNISLPPGQFGGSAVLDFFCGRLPVNDHPYFTEIQHLRVSAHLFIRRDGSMVQFVPFHRRAWHAGESHFQGKDRCNDFSIGIELEGTDTLPYEAVQYEQLAAVTRLLMQVYPALTRERLVGHATIAPGRKTDPGDAFHWQHFIGQLP